MRVKEKKSEYFEKLLGFFQKYPKIFLVNVDMVGSRQIQNVRIQLRGKGELLFGKNTMIRKCIRDNLEEMPQFECLLEHMIGNNAFLFFKAEPSEIRTILDDNFVGAAARPGVVAPVSVSVPAGVTALQPTETSFFQALNISTKITKGSIEILQDVEVVKKGNKVQPGEAVLLQKLGIKPFTYGLTILNVYENGSIFSPAVLDITDADLIKGFQAGVANVAAVSLQIGIPTAASMPHSIINGYKNVLAIALSTDYTFLRAAKLKAFLSDPNAIAAAAAAAAAAATSSSSSASVAKVAVKAPEPEPEPEEEEAAAFDLFD
jgi:large subunit ribosomal protein LP0